MNLLHTKRAAIATASLSWWLLSFTAFFCLNGSCAAMPGSDDDWIPVSPQDLQYKEVPGAKNSSAVQLFYAHHIDYSRGGEFFYHRIKVLTDAGTKYGNVEIIVPPGRPVNNLKARTIRPDGSVIEFKDKTFDKTLFKTKGLKILTRTFTLPEISVGSIIEYKYWLRGDEDYVYDTEWTIEHELFTVREQFSFRYNGMLESAYVTSPGMTKQPTMSKSGHVDLEMENVPPFQSEEHMPPESRYKMHVSFFFSRNTHGSSTRYWGELGRTLALYIDGFIGNHKEVRDAAAEAIGSGTEATQKLRKLYARVQQIRNLSYDRHGEAQNNTQLKPNENVVDVLKHGYGTRKDIALLFAAMAQSAGFEASVVPVSSRRNRLFDQSVLSSSQLDSELVLVKLDGKEVFLDPGTRFCPFGLIRWVNAATIALRTTKYGGTLIETPPPVPARAVVLRTAVLTLSQNGALHGEIKVEFKNGEALERRLDALRTDETGRTKDLEDEVKDWLPQNAVVKLVQSQGWEDTDGPLAARFQVDVPDYVSVAGKRTLLPALLFQAKQKYSLTGEQRKYPVYYPYAFVELDSVSITIPEGYAVESVPAKQDLNPQFARYQNVSQFSGHTLLTQRALVLDGIYFKIDEYTSLKDFFGKVQAGDEEQVVMQTQGGAVHAQN